MCEVHGPKQRPLSLRSGCRNSGSPRTREDEGPWPRHAAHWAATRRANAAAGLPPRIRTDMPGEQGTDQANEGSQRGCHQSCSAWAPLPWPGTLAEHPDWSCWQGSGTARRRREGTEETYLSVPRAQVKGASEAQEPQDSHLPLHSPPPEPSVAMRAHTQETRRHAAKLHPSASWFRHV